MVYIVLAAYLYQYHIRLRFYCADYLSVSSYDVCTKQECLYLYTRSCTRSFHYVTYYQHVRQGAVLLPIQHTVTIPYVIITVLYTQSCTMYSYNNRFRDNYI
jgi:hypothetical protein